jgi:hypothetical protein
MSSNDYPATESRRKEINRERDRRRRQRNQEVREISVGTL